MIGKKIFRIILPVILTTIISANLFVTYNTNAVSAPTIKNIDHVPYTPSAGEIVTVYATVDGSSITSVKLWSEQCSSTQCFLSEEIPMTNIGGNEYKASVKLRNESINMTYRIEVESGGTTYKSSNITLNVGVAANNRPCCRIMKPKDNIVLSNNFTITGIAGDPDGDNTLEKVEIKVDNGQWVITDGLTSWSYQLDTTQFTNGQHTLYARAYDGENYSGIEDDTYNRVLFTIQNEEQPSENLAPTISITFPENNATVKGIINITGTANDPNGDNTIDRVEIKLGNGNWQHAIGTVHWHYLWDTTSINYQEDYPIQARVYDINESFSDKIIYVTVNNQGGNLRPTITITSPENGATVTEKIVKIEGTANDPDGSISTVRIRIRGGEWKTVSGTTSWSYNLDTSTLLNGPVTIKVVAYDDKNLASQEATITLNIQYQPGKGNGTPGFEIIFMITAILIILFLRGRKNEY